MNDANVIPNNRHALLLVGSAKKEHESTSEALGNYLLGQLEAHNFTVETTHVQRVLRTPERSEEFLRKVDAAEIFILAFPVYVDSLPYLATKVLEMIAEHRQQPTVENQPRFVAIANCGFPESHHCQLGLDICQIFAEQAGFLWSGGLALGEGGMISGKQLIAGGGPTSKVCKVLAMSATALAQNEPISQQTIDLMAKPLIPHRLYTSVASVGWHLTAWQNGVHNQLSAQPYEEA